MSRTLKSIGIFVLMSGLLVACSGGESSANNANPPATDSSSVDSPTVPAPMLPTVPPDAEPALMLNDEGMQLVAKVNGTEITLAAFDRAFNRSRVTIGDMASYDAAVTVVLNMLIEQVLINQQAATMGITVTEEEIEAQYQDIRGMIPDDAEWQQWLESNIFTEDAFRESLRNNLITQRVQQAVVDTDTLIVTTVHARHILVSEQEEAETVMTRLDAGENFAQLASVYSNDPNTRNTGGDLGWFVRADLTVPDLADFAMQLQPGQRGGPVMTALGYHVIETLAFGQRPATSEEQYEVGIEQFNNWLETVRTSAIIERYIN